MSSRPPIQPLSDRVPIIDAQGNPTPYFIRYLQERGLDIDGRVTPAQVAQMIIDWSENRLINTTFPLAGGGNLGANLTLSHEDSGVAAGIYGNATNSPQITVDADGHITDIVDVPISGGGGGGALKIGLKIPFVPKTGSTGVSGNFFVSRFDIVEMDYTIDAVCVPFAAAAPGATVRPGIYAANSFGTIGALLASGPPIVGVTTGVNIMPLTTPLAVLGGDYVYIGYQGEGVTTSPSSTTANSAAAFFANTGVLPASPSPTYSPQNWLSMFARIL